MRVGGAGGFVQAAQRNDLRQAEPAHIIVDSSAVPTVLFHEKEARRFETLIALSSCRMSVADMLEAATIVA